MDITGREDNQAAYVYQHSVASNVVCRGQLFERSELLGAAHNKTLREPNVRYTWQT